MRSGGELITVILDYEVREQLAAHSFDLGAGPGLVRLLQVEFDVLALPHILDAREAQASKSILDCLALTQPAYMTGKSIFKT